MTLGARIIEASTTSPGAVQLCTNGEVATRKAVTGADRRLIQVSAGIPASTNDGVTYFDTNAGELGFYDATRGKWMSVRAMEMTFSSLLPLLGGAAMNYEGAGPSSATLGGGLPWDAVLCEITASKDDNTTTTDFEVYAGASLVLTHSVRDTDYVGYDSALSGDFSAGDIVNVAISGGTSLAAAGSIKLVFRRRLT